MDTESKASEQPGGGIGPDEAYHNGFHYFMLALRELSMEPEDQCRGGYNVAQELQYELLLGRCLLGIGRLNAVEEAAVADLVDAVQRLPESAITFASWGAQNVAVMNNSAWAPLRLRAPLLI